MKKIDSEKQHLEKQNKRKIVDCRKNGKYTPSDDSGKVAIKIEVFNCYLLVDPAKIDTAEKKTEYIANYISTVNESRSRMGDLYTVID